METNLEGKKGFPDSSSQNNLTHPEYLLAKRKKLDKDINSWDRDSGELFVFLFYFLEIC